MAVHYPVFLDLAGRPVLVVGGGAIAAGKVKGLLEAGARVRVVSPELDAELQRLSETGALTHERRAFRNSDIDGCAIVIAATDRHELNSAVCQAARARAVLANVVDAPSECDFYTPAVVRRGALQIAISTDGKSPVLARRLREELEGQFGPEWERFVDLLGQARDALLRTGEPVEARKAAQDRLIESDLLAALRAGDETRVRAIVGGSRTA